MTEPANGVSKVRIPQGDARWSIMLAGKKQACKKKMLTLDERHLKRFDQLLRGLGQGMVLAKGGRVGVVDQGSQAAMAWSNEISASSTSSSCRKEDA